MQWEYVVTLQAPRSLHLKWIVAVSGTIFLGELTQEGKSGVLTECSVQ